jgi:ferredoxin-NADP reductase
MAIRGESNASAMTSELTDIASGAHWQNAVVSRIIVQTPRIKSFFFKLPAPIAFVAGQHVDVRLTAPDGYHAMRSYSIASAPDGSEEIELVVERLADGEVSPFLHDTVVIGDSLEIRGPLGGHFIWSIEDGGPLLLAGGGSGVVPLMSMLRYRRNEKSGVPVVLIFSARTWDDVIFRDELLELDGRKDGFELILTLTREAPRRKGDYGRRVDAALVMDGLAHLPAPPHLVYVCGTNQFVNAAADGVVAAGIAPAIVRTERYGV